MHVQAMVGAVAADASKPSASESMLAVVRRQRWRLVKWQAEWYGLQLVLLTAEEVRCFLSRFEMF